MVVVVVVVVVCGDAVVVVVVLVVWLCWLSVAHAVIGQTCGWHSEYKGRSVGL